MQTPAARPVAKPPAPVPSTKPEAPAPVATAKPTAPVKPAAETPAPRFVTPASVAASRPPAAVVTPRPPVAHAALPPAPPRLPLRFRRVPQLLRRQPRPHSVAAPPPPAQPAPVAGCGFAKPPPTVVAPPRVIMPQTGPRPVYKAPPPVAGQSIRVRTGTAGARQTDFSASASATSRPRRERVPCCVPASAVRCIPRGQSPTGARPLGVGPVEARWRLPDHRVPELVPVDRLVVPVSVTFRAA